MAREGQFVPSLRAVVLCPDVEAATELASEPAMLSFWNELGDKKGDDFAFGTICRGGVNTGGDVNTRGDFKAAAAEFSFFVSVDIFLKETSLIGESLAASAAFSVRRKERCPKGSNPLGLLGSFSEGLSGTEVFSSLAESLSESSSETKASPEILFQAAWLLLFRATPS